MRKQTEHTLAVTIVVQDPMSRAQAAKLIEELLAKDERIAFVEGNQEERESETVPDSVVALVPSVSEEPGVPMTSEFKLDEQNFYLALALGYNELAKHATREGDKVYWRLMRTEAVKKLSYDPFAISEKP
jgi:hypothetical protein